MTTDLSSGAVSVPALSPSANRSFAENSMLNDMANYQRSWFGRLLSGTAAADLQDWERTETSADNQLLRDFFLQQNANAFSAEQAQINRDFEERLSNTAYQRAVADMKASGLNPAILLSGQNGASTPSTVPAQASAASSRGANYHHSTSDNSEAILASLIGGVVKLYSGILEIGSNSALISSQIARNTAQASFYNNRK